MLTLWISSLKKTMTIIFVEEMRVILRGLNEQLLSNRESSLNLWIFLTGQLRLALTTTSSNFKQAQVSGAENELKVDIVKLSLSLFLSISIYLNLSLSLRDRDGADTIITFHHHQQHLRKKQLENRDEYSFIQTRPGGVDTLM